MRWAETDWPNSAEGLLGAAHPWARPSRCSRPAEEALGQEAAGLMRVKGDAVAQACWRRGQRERGLALAKRASRGGTRGLALATAPWRRGSAKGQ